MPNLLDTINNDLKESMRSRAELPLAVLRMLTAAIKNKKIELWQKEDLSDEQIVAVIKSEVKKRKDSITAYEDGNRPDLAEREKQEMAVLEKYIPAQMSDGDLIAIVERVVASVEGVTMKEFGRIMGQVMTQVKGMADGDRVSAAVKDLLGKK